MKIGIDLKELQTASAYRGIGEVSKQVTNNLLPLLAKDSNVDEVILFMYKDKEDEVLKIIDIPKSLNFSIKYYDPSTLVTGRFGKFKNAFFAKKDLEVEKVDAYLSFSAMGYIPRTNNVYLVWHDSIPLVLHHIYFLRNKNDSISLFIKSNSFFMTAILKMIKYRTRQKIKRVKHLITDSQYTKDDFNRIFPELKFPIDVALLGVSEAPSKTLDTVIKTSPEKPYLLFVGGIDPKREIAQLIEQYNDLKLAGYDLQLVLAGKSFDSIDTVEEPDIKRAILESPYRDDIINVGYISDEDKSSLYSQALVFVYPTIYEGYGLPLLEAMLAKTLVLTYNNSSLPEVGDKYAFYVDDSSQIADKVIEMYNLSNEERQQIIEESYNYAKQFTWAKTAQRYYDIIMEDFN